MHVGASRLWGDGEPQPLVDNILECLSGLEACEVVAKECRGGVDTSSRLSADVGLATTGVAGPTEQENQPVGTVFLGLALGEHVEAVQVRLPGDRMRIRQYGVISALNLLRLRLIRSARQSVMR